jgi:DNA polymerase-3 subunit delta'
MAFSRQEALRLLGKALSEDRLGHAYLVSGRAGSGVEEVASELAGMFLGCGPVSVQANPDFHLIAPGSKSRRLLIDQVRELEEVLHRTPEAGSRKVGMIRDADRLMPAAANAFLKTLEEPPDGSLLLLTTELPEALLETVRSRCIMVPLRPLANGPVSSREERLMAQVKTSFAQGAPSDATAAFAFTKVFRDLLTEAREEAVERAGEDLAAEKQHFSKTTDGADWDVREDQLKATTEAEVLQERSRLLGVVADHFGTSLRSLHEGGRTTGAAESRRLLLSLEALERLRASLERGLQESLVLEAGFLELMTAYRSESCNP